MRIRITKPLLGLCVLCASLCWNAAARANETEYDRMIREGLSEYELGHFEEAAVLFERAHAQAPSARTHRGLGLAYFESRKYALAIPHLQAALTDQRRPLTAEQRANVEATLERASRFVAHLRPALDPRDAIVEIDGHLAPAEGEWLLDTGRHELFAHAPGHLEQRRIIEAVAGSTSTLEIRLEPEPAAGEGSSVQVAKDFIGPRPQPAPEPAAGPGGNQRLLPIVVMAVGGATLIAAAATGAIANGKYSDLEKKCPAYQCSDPKLKSELSSGSSLVTATNVLLVSGLVVAAAGGTWFFLSGSHPSASETRIAASCTGSGCAAFVVGRL